MWYLSFLCFSVLSLGVQVGDKLYTDLDYADDVVLMAGQTATLRSALVEFHQTAANLGLHCICHGRKLRYRTWVPVILRQIGETGGNCNILHKSAIFSTINNILFMKRT